MLIKIQDAKCPKCGEQASDVLDYILVQSPITPDEEADDTAKGHIYFEYADDRQEILWDTQSLCTEEGKVTLFCPAGHSWRIAADHLEPTWAALVKLDRIASAYLEHGREETKELAKQIFDICEAVLNPKEKPNG